MCASVWNISISHDGARTFFTCNENQNKKTSCASLDFDLN